MIKASGATADGLPLLVLGLTRENLDRLPDQPIQLSPEQMLEVGMPAMTIILIAGETNESVSDLALMIFGKSGTVEYG